MQSVCFFSNSQLATKMPQQASEEYIIIESFPDINERKEKLAADDESEVYSAADENPDDAASDSDASSESDSEEVDRDEGFDEIDKAAEKLSGLALGEDSEKDSPKKAAAIPEPIILTCKLIDAAQMVVNKRLKDHHITRNLVQYIVLCRELLRLSPSLGDDSTKIYCCSECGFPGRNASTHEFHQRWYDRIFRVSRVPRTTMP
jgi:hypothetical protein